MEKEIYKGCDQECFECCYSECRIPANLISLGEKKSRRAAARLVAAIAKTEAERAARQKRMAARRECFERYCEGLERERARGLVDGLVERMRLNREAYFDAGGKRGRQKAAATALAVPGQPLGKTQKTKT